MLIDKLLSDYESSYSYLERYVNDGSPSKINNTTSGKTSPKSKYKYLTLKQYDFGSDILYEEYGENPPDYILPHSMIIHPDMITNPILKKYIKLAKPLDGIQVSPTASGRTTKVYNKPLFLKVSYSKLLGRIPRIIDKKAVLASCETTAILKKLIDSGVVNSKFSILREDAGRVIIFKDDNVEWGVVFREFSPYPYINEKEYMIPFFSLFGSDVNAPNDKPLLIQLYEKQNKSMDEFILECILKPLYSTYFESLIYGGIELEAHAQNMLLTIDDKFQISRIVCRDLESAGRDFPLMQLRGNNTNFDSFPYKCNRYSEEIYSNGYSKYTIMHSFMFDFKLGEYITTPLLNCAEKYCKLNRKYIVGELKCFNSKYIKMLPKDFFPIGWCYYQNIVWGERKREYIWEKNPHYR